MKLQTTGWDVNFDGTGFQSNYNISKSTITSAMPGDTVVYQVTYSNDSAKATDFYLSTDVINSLEEKSINGGASTASGGAYSYKLSYTLNGNTTTLYNSQTVGGDNSTVVGLKQIQGSLSSGQNTYFNIGKLATGDTGVVEIEIALDGNSQDNSYMETLASLDVRFGVEDETTQTNVVNNTETNQVVYEIPGGSEVIIIEEPGTPVAYPKTGDSAFPLIISGVMLGIGILFILLYFWMTKRNREKEA